MDDPEIRETVESILGKGVKVVDCEKTFSVRSEELLFVNGIPVVLEGKDGLAIKQALSTGRVPPCELLNTLLIKTGILDKPVKLDTSLSVKSSTVTKEEFTVARGGKIIDEQKREVEENRFYSSAMTEVFEPLRHTLGKPLETGFKSHLLPNREGPRTADLDSFRSQSRDSGNISDQATSSMDSMSLSDPISRAEIQSKKVIAQEPSCSSSESLVHRDGKLVSGTLDSLIQLMVPTEVNRPDPIYSFTFLLCSRLFVEPHELLGNIWMRSKQERCFTDNNNKTGQKRLVENTVNLLEYWSEQFPYDFREKRLMQLVKIITQDCYTINSDIREKTSSLLRNLLQRLTALENYEKKVATLSSLPDDNSTDVVEICPKPSHMAQQLTAIELEKLSFIGPEEFVQTFTKENYSSAFSYLEIKQTRNFEHYVQWFNRLSYFVATQVCRSNKKRHRVRTIEYWIETGRECCNIGNFNSLMAIIAGLNMSPISRLKRTWSKIHLDKFSILEHQMDPSGNFTCYRSTLKAAMWRSHGATDQRQRIIIPFFSLFVKDLYFLNKGCSNRLPNGHVNIEKFGQLARHVMDFMTWKRVKCPFDEDSSVQEMLYRGHILNENELAMASFECEPPDGHQEREQHRALKSGIAIA